MSAKMRPTLADEFTERGYVVIEPAIDNFDRIAADLIKDLEPSYDGTGRIEQGWRKHRLVRQLACNQQILDTLRLLYGRQAFPFQTLNFNRGTQQATHSDTIHFDSNPADFMAGVWIALEDNDANNGPLRYYPGSHKLPRVTLADAGITRLGDADPYKLYRTVYEPLIGKLVEGRPYEEAHIKRGQALIWSANLLHGGAPILDPTRTRHSQVTHYYFEGCSYYTPLLSDETGIYRRYPTDIRTGRLIPGIENGRRLRAPFLEEAKNLIKRKLRAVNVYSR